MRRPDRARASPRPASAPCAGRRLPARCRVEEPDDGLVGSEGAFVTCTFSIVMALGEAAAARALCEKVLCYASPLRLYADEIEPASDRHLGNFPEAFTRLALVSAVMQLIHADDKLTRAEPLLEMRGREVVQE